MKNKTETSEAIAYTDINRHRATGARPDGSSGNPKSEPPKFGGILYFDDGDALFDDPIEADRDENANGA